MSTGRVVSRRDFLKLGTAGLAAWFVSPLLSALAQETSMQGRIIDPVVNLHALPDLTSEISGVFWKDNLITITGATVGGEQPSHNRIWYKVQDKGYVHSGVVQPVRNITNEPVSALPEGGILAEVTVPFTDSRYGPGRTNQFAYRHYYETTCWVDKLVNSQEGEPWYRVIEDKWELINYIPASDLRIVPAEELAPIAPNVPPEAKRLEVDTSKQLLIAYEYDKPVYAARAATGARFSTGAYYTPAGRFMTYHKRPSRHMAAGNPAAGGYDLPGVPWVCYFTESGVSIHGTFWHNDYGKPRSHGCVNLTPRSARWVYLWTHPQVPSNEQMVYEKTGTILDVY
jgi:lipoprotein-anchoring transpeptidase ErfK/SrfK